MTAGVLASDPAAGPTNRVADFAGRAGRLGGVGMSARRIVIVGYGMAGARLAERLRDRDPDGTRVAITVLAGEDRPAYNRVLLSAVLAGSMAVDAVRLHDDDWADRHGIDLRPAAADIDRDARTVTLHDGSTVDYDVLVLATGATPWLPPVEGLSFDEPGVAAFRTLDDCERILAAVAPGAPVAVLGGGLLGLEAARGLAGRGCLVTVVHPVGHLMERQLDPAAARVLAGVLRDQGIEFRLGAPAARYLPGDGLKLADGSHVPADLVVVSAGVRADTALAEAAGLTVDRGVLVDDALRTSDPRIHALGDCAHHPGTVSGLVQPAWDQADVLADLLTGARPAARYRGSPVVTRLKGVDLAALGDALTDVHDPDAEVLCLTDPARGRYAKLVLRADRVTGAILLGAPDAAATITQLYDRGTPAPADRLALLLGRALPGAGVAASPGDLPAAATVCRCNSVTKAALITAWRAGASDVDGLVRATKASTGCGTCRDTVCGIADWLSAADPD